MVTVAQVRDFLEAKAPVYMKLDFDNVGLLVGRPERIVTLGYVSLDITPAVIAEAARAGAQLIVSHHPVIFSPEKTVVSGTYDGDRILGLAENGMAGICMHTNLDTADGGVNDALMQALGGRVTGLLAPHGKHPDGRDFGISRLGELPVPMELSEFLAHVQSALQAGGLRYVAGGRPVQRLACCGGAGAGEIAAAAAAGCDTFVTADVKYDQFIEAAYLGLNLVDAGHFPTENVVVPVLHGWLQEAFPAVEWRVSAVNAQPEQFFFGG